MLKRLARDESGQGLVEYALIVFLIAVVVIAILLLRKYPLDEKTYDAIVLEHAEDPTK